MGVGVVVGVSEAVSVPSDGVAVGFSVNPSGGIEICFLVKISW